MEIIHLRHSEIDFERWDKAIASSQNELIYAYSWYLNCVSPGWEALISGSYEYIMPLPVKKRYGFSYVVQPALTQQCGIFSSNFLSNETVEQFIGAIPYISYELNLNESNLAYKYPKRPNLILELDSPYKRLYSNFSSNTKRNIIKANSFSLTTDLDLSVNDFLRFYYNHEKNYSLPDKKIVENLINKATELGKIRIFGVRNSANEIISVLGLLISDDRLIYLLPSSNIEGKDKSAMFLLLNEIIKNNAQSNRVLDFEGSAIEGVARFYKGFGAKLVYYNVVKRFRPKIFKQIKK